MSGSQLEVSKLDSFAISYPVFQVAKLDSFAVNYPQFQVSKLNSFAVNFPKMQFTKVTAYVVLFAVPVVPPVPPQHRLVFGTRPLDDELDENVDAVSRLKYYLARAHRDVSYPPGATPPTPVPPPPPLPTFRVEMDPAAFRVPPGKKH